MFSDMIIYLKTVGLLFNMILNIFLIFISISFNKFSTLLFGSDPYLVDESDQQYS